VTGPDDRREYSQAPDEYWRTVSRVPDVKVSAGTLEGGDNDTFTTGAPTRATASGLSRGWGIALVVSGVLLLLPALAITQAWGAGLVVFAILVILWGLSPRILALGIGQTLLGAGMVSMLLIGSITILADHAPGRQDCVRRVQAWARETGARPKSGAFEQLVKNCMAAPDPWRVYDR
jgi:hypothetical protein